MRRVREWESALLRKRKEFRLKALIGLRLLGLSASNCLSADSQPAEFQGLSHRYLSLLASHSFGASDIWASPYVMVWSVASRQSDQFNSRTGSNSKVSSMMMAVMSKLPFLLPVRSSDLTIECGILSLESYKFARGLH